MPDTEIFLIADVKPVKVNEGTPLLPIDLKSYLENPENVPLEFSATLGSGGALPNGLEFSPDGVLAGKPAVGTAKKGAYPVKVLVIGPDNKVEFNFDLFIYKAKTAEEIEKLKQDSWQTLAKQGILPESLQEIIERPITARDIYHLLEQFASFTIWNADDMRLAENGELLKLADVSDHFSVYDFEVCLVATPKDLYSHQRSLGDALQTAKAMTREVYRRGWHVEFGGFDRMADAAWYEAYDLNEAGEHQMEVRNYEPAEVTEVMAETKQANPK